MAGDISTLLSRWRDGDPEAAEQIVARTYTELRRIARRHLRGERAGHTLQTTALLHEAWLRLLRDGPGPVADRDAFLRLMSVEMRRRLVDHARRRLADKRGGRFARQPLDTSVPAPAPDPEDDLEATLGRLDRALERLCNEHPRAAQVVQLRFLGDLSLEDTATELGISIGTVKRDWTFARAWLAASLQNE
jgi:RNA polymerase sigma factor (TIGR02999 family)